MAQKGVFTIVFLFIYFNSRLILYNIVLVLPYIKMNPPRVYTCFPSWTSLPPSSPYHPSGSSQCTSPEHPVSCIETGLASCFTYDNIHVSRPFSQIIPPSPSPTESKRLFYTSVSLLLSCTVYLRVIVQQLKSNLPNFMMGKNKNKYKIENSSWSTIKIT